MNKKGIKLNKDDTLKYVKYSASQVMSNPRNGLLQKINDIIKEDIGENIKRSKLNKIINAVVSGIYGSNQTLIYHLEKM